VNCAVAIAVITDGAVEHVIAEYPVVRFSLRGVSGLRSGVNTESISDRSRTGPEQLTVNLDHAGIACLDWSKLRVITDLRNLAAGAIDDIYQPFAGPGFLDYTINRDTDHDLRPCNYSHLRIEHVRRNFINTSGFSLVIRARRAIPEPLLALVTSVVTTVTVVPVSLDQVAGSCTRARTNQCSASATN
jgi:hypothetical protein